MELRGVGYDARVAIDTLAVAHAAEVEALTRVVVTLVVTGPAGTRATDDVIVAAEAAAARRGESFTGDNGRHRGREADLDE